jgi:hypothetical protein
MIDRTPAIAYGFASVIALLLVGAMLWIMFIPFINGMGNELNTFGAEGKASRQTFATFSIAQTMFQYGVPVFLLLIALYYAIDRALLKRKEEVNG